MRFGALDAELDGMFPRPMAMSTAARRHSAWNLPNVLTYARLLAVPVVAGCLLSSHDFWMRWLALGIYIAAGVTDFFAGYLARAWGQQSSLGRILDPIADKLLVAATLLVLVSDHGIAGWSIWAGIVILCREILVSGLREFLAEFHASVPVSTVAKYKTTLQLVALGFLIAGPAGDAVVPIVSVFGLILLWVAALLTLYTGWDYLRAGMKHVME